MERTQFPAYDLRCRVQRAIPKLMICGGKWKGNVPLDILHRLADVGGRSTFSGEQIYQEGWKNRDSYRFACSVVVL